MKILVSCAGNKWPIALLAAVMAAGTACLTKVEKIARVPGKQNLLTATRQQLVELINQKYAAVRSVKYSRMRIQVEGFYPENEEKKSYPRGSGYLVVQRPGWILMNINNPLTSSTVAAMAADGRNFQLFVPGENKYVTGPVDVEVNSDNPLYNIRPQHVAEAVFVEPLQGLTERSFYVYEDSDPLFAYYMIAELQNAHSQPQLLRRLWIDRSTLRLVRQQWYGDGGQVVSEAGYGSEAVVDGVPVFVELTLMRPLDRYRLRFTFETEAVKVNETIEEGAFKLVRPPGTELVEVKGRVKL